MLQQEKPEDFVIATNEAHSVREFVEAAFKEIGKEIVYVFLFKSLINGIYWLKLNFEISSWEGSDVNEVGKEKDTGIVRIKVNPKYYRPTEVVSITIQFVEILIYHCFKFKEFLLGNAEKAEKELKWKPKISFNVNKFNLNLNLYFIY